MMKNNRKVNPANKYASNTQVTAAEKDGDENSQNMGDIGQAYYIKMKYAVEKWALTTVYNMGFTNRKNDHRRYTEKRFREIIVGVQAQLHSKKRSYGLYYWIKVGDLNRVQQLISQDESIINKRDAAGAAAFHLAYVFQHYHIGHYLVERYPELAVLPYNGHHTAEIWSEFPELSHRDFNNTMMPYTGATILHIAIVRRNFEEVRWLLSFYHRNRSIAPDALSSLLSANVTGKFFAADGDFYIGGFPLQFAVCANHTAIFDILLSYASKLRITVPDTHKVRTEILHHKPDTTAIPDSTPANGAVPETFSISDTNLKEAPHSTHDDKIRDFAAADEHSKRSDHELDAPYPNIALLSPRSAQRQEAQATAETSSPKRTIAGQNIIFMSDLSGNTVLHLCVLYGLRAMYKHVYAAALRVITAEVKALYAEYAHKGVGTLVRMQSIPHTDHGYLMLPKVMNIPDRDKYAEWVAAESAAKVDERLVLALNRDLHSPLTLAAAIICKHDVEAIKTRKLAMFHDLLQHMKQPLWSYGAIKVSRIKLEGIEIKYNLERYQDVPAHIHRAPRHAAIDWLCINDADPKALLLPEIASFVETKWERCGYPSFLVRFIVHSSITVLITLIMLHVNVTPRVINVTGQVVLVNILYITVAAVMLWILLGETKDICTHGWRYLAFRGVAKYDKVVRCVKVVSFLVFAMYKCISMAHGADTVDGKVVTTDTADLAVKVSLSVCVMASWLHVYYFLMGFDSTGPFMLTIFRIVGRNVPYFLRFYAVIVVTFACGLSLLANDGTVDAAYGWMNIITAIWTLLQVTVGAEPTHNSIDISSQVPQHLYWLADILLTMYYASVVILMLNLLIAMIGHTFEEYNSYNHALLLMEKYNIMHAMERSMSPQEYEYYRSLYSHRVKVLIDSLTVANSAKTSLSRAVSGVFSASGKTHSGEFVKHATIESSNYDFEMQEVNADWFSEEAVAVDAARSKQLGHSPPRIVLLLVNPQCDFYPGGAMASPAAAGTEDRVTELIRAHGDRISSIIVTLATHHYGNLAHKQSWESPEGLAPPLGTTITNRSLLEGEWAPRTLQLQDWYEQYTKRIETECNQVLKILPEHCIIGTQGHSVNAHIHSALQEWASTSKVGITYVRHGENKRTQMYSALRAAVEDPLDPSTSLNMDLLSTLNEADKVLLCGQQLSQAVQHTVRDLLGPGGISPSKLTLLTDGCGVSPGCEEETAAFLASCTSRGCTVTTCANAL